MYTYIYIYIHFLHIDLKYVYRSRAHKVRKARMTCTIIYIIINIPTVLINYKNIVQAIKGNKRRDSLPKPR